MGTPEDNTADATKCAGCGRPFVSCSGAYIRTGFPGMYHKRCLPHGPAPDQYHAGLIAGLREAAAWHDLQVETLQAFVPASSQIKRDIEIHRDASAAIRALIERESKEG